MATEAIQAEQDAFVERILGALSVTIDVYSIYLGDTLGFYRLYAGSAPQSVGESQ